MANSQLLYTLPISLFGMSIAASELPAMAEDTAHGAGSAALIERLKSGSARIAFFVVPTSFAFVALGHQVAGVVFQSGAFSAADARWVWGTLAGAAIGLLPQAWGRLLNSAHYALGDTRTPLRFATFRVALSVVLGAAIAFQGPRILGIDPKWGTVGLAFGTAVAGTLEWFLLRRSLISKLGPFGLASDRHFRWWGAAAIATVVGVATYLLLPRSPVLITGPASLGAFGVTYLAVAWALGIPEVRLLGLNRP